MCGSLEAAILRTVQFGSEVMITGAQITAGRALLGGSIPDLARRAGITIADVQEIENATKMTRRRIRDAVAIPQALEDAGISFIDSVGVQLSPG